MKRNELLVGVCIVGIVLAATAALYLNGKSLSTLTPYKSSSATSTLVSINTSTTSVASSTRSVKNIALAANVESDVAASTTADETQNTESSPELTASGGALLKSLVNIVCLSNDPSIPSISGSGVIIDSRGIILTAAHVAQFFLLQDYLGADTVSCLVRTGSPARRAYTAEPIYVSQSWIENNPNTLTTTDPKGTGQYDVALLGITGTATSTPVPSSFPSVPLATTDPQNNESVAVASYGAQYLTSSELNYSLYPIVIFGSIVDRYTYGTGSVDVIAVQGSAAAQEGSSGGGIVNTAGQLIGTITTSAVSGSVASRVLNAVTPEHLRSTFLLDTGTDLDTTLASESVPQLIAAFANQSKNLGAQLMNDVQTAKSS